MTRYDDNPWKGLNFYVEGESLFGRDLEIRTLAQYIINNSQTVLYGESGIGKSSIVNAGIFPIARQQGLHPVPLRLEHDQENCQGYLSQIKHAFDESHIGITEKQPAVGNSDESLWEFFHRHQFFDPVTMESVRPLVVLDQFEEIFTLQRNEAVKKEFFSQLADLINEVTPQYIVDAQRANIQKPNVDTANQESLDFVLDLVNDEQQETNYVDSSDFNLVFVLREDFLSYFERYTAYIPAMKSNRFPLLPINEEQAAEIIMRPREGLVSKEVAKLIIQKVTGNTDFKLDGIPEIEVNATVLSLYLSRLYLKKGSQNTITAEMVNQFSDFIIKDYYEESIADIPEDEIEKLEDALITYDGRRDNDSLINLTHQDEKGRSVSDETIRKLVEDSKLLRRFSYQGDIRLEYMHDTLCPTVNERIKQREAIRLQEEERKRQEEEKAKIRQEEELKRQEIERKAELERMRHEQETQRIKNRNRNRWLLLAASLLGLILLAALLRHPLLVADYTCTYANFTTVNGWPVGINPINDTKDDDSRIVYYRLTRKGRLNKNPFYKVEVMAYGSYYPRLTTNKFIESPAVGLWNTELSTDKRAAAFADLQKRTAYWVYSASDQDHTTVGKCTAFGLDSTELYSVQFNRDNIYVGTDENKYVQWAVYYDSGGKVMMINDNGIDRMRQTVNNGTITSCVFFSMLGVPQKNERGAYGYEYETNDTTHLLQKMYRVNKFGKRTNEEPITFIEYKYGRTKKTSLYDVYESHFQRGIIVKKYKSFYDILAFHEDGKLKFCSFHPDINNADSVISYSYDEMERPMFRHILSRGEIVYSEVYSYNGKNKEIKKKEDDRYYTEKYTHLNDTTDINELFQKGAKINLTKLNEKGDDLTYHKCIRTISKNPNSRFIIETNEYFDTEGNPIKPDPSNVWVNQYSKYIIYRDTTTQNIVYEYYYDANDDIKKSELFEYDSYGNLIAKAVAGVDFYPVRCIDWSWYDLCCYKMSVLIPLYTGVPSVSASEQGIFASMSGINEFNEHSFIMGYGDKGEFCNKTIDESPIEYFSSSEENGLIRTGFCSSKTIINPCDMSKSAFFVHILSKKGTFYSSGLKDGDIIISINGRDVTPTTAKLLERKITDRCNLVIARAIPKEKKYRIIPFTVPAGDPLIHVHHMELTTEEQTRLNKYLK